MESALLLSSFITVSSLNCFKFRISGSIAPQKKIDQCRENEFVYMNRTSVSLLIQNTNKLHDSVQNDIRSSK
ncbi:uncharacterized protein OCT59_009031 [Rhizophagus irregularis]|nr:hypothetical protein OCT59_009031 [Rhizophagus irregularis]CAB4475021.1 unnamed protein product [Rhizophagus irregularis]